MVFGVLSCGNENKGAGGEGGPSPSFQDLFFFTADDGTGGRKLWKSDGTEKGMGVVKEIQPSGGLPLQAFLVDVNGMLFFVADNGQSGFELWKSDGTEGEPEWLKISIPERRTPIRFL